MGKNGKNCYLKFKIPFDSAPYLASSNLLLRSIYQWHHNSKWLKIVCCFEIAEISNDKWDHSRLCKFFEVFFSVISMELPEYAMTYHAFYSIFEFCHTSARVYDELILANAQCNFFISIWLCCLLAYLSDTFLQFCCCFSLFALFLKTNTIDISCYALKINGYLVRDSTFGSIAINLALALAYIYICVCVWFKVYVCARVIFWIFLLVLYPNSNTFGIMFYLHPSYSYICMYGMY